MMPRGLVSGALTAPNRSTATPPSMCAYDSTQPLDSHPAPTLAQISPGTAFNSAQP